MKTSGGLSEDRKKLIAYVAFGVLFVGVMYYELSDFFFTPAPTAPPVAASAPAVSAPVKTPGVATSQTAEAVVPAGNVAGVAKGAATSATLDPTLHMGAMLVTESLVYTGSGRNIFSAVSTPVAVVIPKPVAPVRPAPVAVTAPVHTGSPPPPPIDLKFFGTTASPSGNRQAFLLHGDDVQIGVDGDVLLRRYKIVAVHATSIEVEDMTNNNKQTLPLQAGQ